MKQFVLKLILLTIAVFYVTISVDYCYRQLTHITYPLPEHFLVEPTIAHQYQIVKLGNSHASDGITLEGYKLRSLDLAGIAQRFSLDLAMLKQYTNQIEPNALIIIDASQISFSHRVADRNDDIQHRYYHKMSPFLIPDVSIGDYIQSEVIPFVRSGYLLREHYKENVEKKLEEDRKPKLETVVVPSLELSPVPIVNKFTKNKKVTQQIANKNLIKIIPKVEEYNVEAIEKELAHPTKTSDEYLALYTELIAQKWKYNDEFNQKYFEINRRDFEQLINYCLEHHWRPVVITIPVISDLEEKLGDEYKQKYLYDNIKKTNLHSVEYIDFSEKEDIKQNTTLFKNSDHLSIKGSIVFSYALMKELIHRGYLPPEVDGYDHTSITNISPKK